MQRLRLCLICCVVLLLAAVALGPVWAEEPPEPYPSGSGAKPAVLFDIGEADVIISDAHAFDQENDSAIAPVYFGQSERLQEVGLRPFDLGAQDEVQSDMTYIHPPGLTIVTEEPAAGSMASIPCPFTKVYTVVNGMLNCSYSQPVWNRGAHTCTFTAHFTNKSKTPLYPKMALQLFRLDGPGCRGLQGCRFNGCSIVSCPDQTMQVPYGKLRTGESAHFDVKVKLGDWDRFTLMVNVKGTYCPEDLLGINDYPDTQKGGLPYSPFIIDPGEPGAGMYSVFLPLASP